jgi:hypothetical protein
MIGINPATPTGDPTGTCQYSATVTVRTPEKTAGLLLKVEQHVHRAGWDQPPFLGSLHLSRPGAISLLPFPFRIESPPGDFLAYIAQICEANEQHANTFVSRSDATGPTFGLAFVSEGWMLKGTPEQTKAFLASNQRISQQDNKIEARSVSAIDVTGNIYFINRVRGEKPTWHNDMEVGGLVVESLRRILLAGMRTLPGQDQAVLDLSTTFIKNRDDMLAASDIRRQEP